MPLWIFFFLSCNWQKGIRNKKKRQFHQEKIPSPQLLHKDSLLFFLWFLSRSQQRTERETSRGPRVRIAVMCWPKKCRTAFKSSACPRPLLPPNTAPLEATVACIKVIYSRGELKLFKMTDVISHICFQAGKKRCSCKWTAAAVCTAVDAARWSKNEASRRAGGGKSGSLHHFQVRVGWRKRKVGLVGDLQGPRHEFIRWKLNRGGCERLDVILAKSLERKKKKERKPPAQISCVCSTKPEMFPHDHNKEEKNHPERILLCSVAGICF